LRQAWPEGQSSLTLQRVQVDVFSQRPFRQSSVLREQSLLRLHDVRLSGMRTHTSSPSESLHSRPALQSFELLHDWPQFRRSVLT
jgi:hypothetical protein